MTDPDRDLAANYFDRRLAAAYGNIPADQLTQQRERYIADVLASPAAMSQLRDLAARTDALQAELAACRAAGRVARATDQHRRDTAPKEEL